MCVEGSDNELRLLRMPLDNLARAVKQSQKCEKDFQVISNALRALQEREKEQPNIDQTIASLEKISIRLKATRAKFSEAGAVVKSNASAVQRRVDYLGDYDEVGASPILRLARVNRFIAQYLYGEGYSALAHSLAEKASVADLVDPSLIMENVQGLMESLTERHSVVESLHWCSENRAKLQEMDSVLELELRLQEGVEMCRADRPADAVLHVRRHCQPYFAAPHHFSKICTALTNYAMKGGSYFSSQRWTELACTLRQEAVRLAALESSSGGESFPSLVQLLRAGTLHLRCPQRFSSAALCTDDPMTSEHILTLCDRSTPCVRGDSHMLLCRISRLPMDSENPPMVYPNGRVISVRGLKEVIKRSGGGTQYVTCPATGEVYPLSSLRKAVLV